jgi:hypothetical protein
MIVLGGLSASVEAQVTMSLLKTIDTSSTATAGVPSYVGNNVSAIAWDGTDLFIGGYNSSGATAATGIVKVSSALTTPTFGAAFGVFNTANSRGITGLAKRGNLVYAALDNGAGSSASARGFDAMTGGLLWNIAPDGGTPPTTFTRRGMGGAAIDPGFGGSSPSAGSASFLAPGSGRRHSLDPATGAYNYGVNAGGIINFATASTTWRDHDYDPSTGDLYTRESNRVGKAVRTGDNTFATQQVLVTNTVTSVIDNENISFVNSLSYGSFVIFNDRSSTASGQVAANVIKAVTTSGAALTLDLRNSDYVTPLTLPTGNGAYDFSWDAGTQTLAISDFANRKVYSLRSPRRAWRV